MPDFRGGWKKDKYDGRDWLHRPKLVKVPPFFSNFALLPDVRNQGHVGACVGFGLGANLCGVANSLSAFTEWYSPTWIYNGARFIEGTLPFDVGCEPGDALDWLLNHGCLLEHFWPYDSNKLDTSVPSSAREQEAIKYANFAYWRVDNGVDGIMSALADGHLVSIGTPWFQKWMEAPGGILAEVTPSDAVAGGHETCLYGYDTAKKVVLGMNSWGTGWGDKGFYTMPMSAFAVFKALGGYDAHYITFDATPAPTPEKKCWLKQLFWRRETR
jgi:hypothetical protein